MTTRTWGLALLAAAAVLAGAAKDRWRVPAARRPPLAGPGAVCELGRVDRASTTAARCIACHDGSAGPGVQFEMRARPDHEVAFAHPVEVPYEEARQRTRKLHAEERLPRDVVLVGGRVSCTTCHDPASPARGHVARPAGGLCQSCHDL